MIWVEEWRPTPCLASCPAAESSSVPRGSACRQRRGPDSFATPLNSRSSGPIRRVRRDYTPEPVTAADRAAHLAKAGLPNDDARARYRSFLARAPIPSGARHQWQPLVSRLPSPLRANGRAPGRLRPHLDQPEPDPRHLARPRRRPPRPPFPPPPLTPPSAECRATNAEIAKCRVIPSPAPGSSPPPVSLARRPVGSCPTPPCRAP